MQTEPVISSWTAMSASSSRLSRFWPIGLWQSYLEFFCGTSRWRTESSSRLLSFWVLPHCKWPKTAFPFFREDKFLIDIIFTVRVAQRLSVSVTSVSTATPQNSCSVLVKSVYGPLSRKALVFSRAPYRLCVLCFRCLTSEETRAAANPAAPVQLVWSNSHDADIRLWAQTSIWKTLSDGAIKTEMETAHNTSWRRPKSQLQLMCARWLLANGNAAKFSDGRNRPCHPQ